MQRSVAQYTSPAPQDAASIPKRGNGQGHLDRPTGRAVTGKTADWSEIAKDCVAFANATGGRLLLGIEDGQSEPPADQRIPAGRPGAAGAIGGPDALLRIGRGREYGGNISWYEKQRVGRTRKPARSQRVGVWPPWLVLQIGGRNIGPL